MTHLNPDDLAWAREMVTDFQHERCGRCRSLERIYQSVVNRDAIQWLNGNDFQQRMVNAGHSLYYKINEIL